MRPIGVTLVCLYQLLRGVIGLVFGLFIVFYTGPTNQFVARASQGNAAERWMANIGHAAASLSSYLLSCTRSRAMAFCAGETGGVC